jgi:hypothetical protein
MLEEQSKKTGNEQTGQPEQSSLLANILATLQDEF